MFVRVKTRVLKYFYLIGIKLLVWASGWNQCLVFMWYGLKVTEGNFYYIIKNSSTAYFGAVQKMGKSLFCQLGNGLN